MTHRRRDLTAWRGFATGGCKGQRQPRPAPARALSEAERNEVFEVLCSERFADRAPAEVYATLLDEGVYLCSERTMYRILAGNKAVRERRAQRAAGRLIEETGLKHDL